METPEDIYRKAFRNLVNEVRLQAREGNMPSYTSKQLEAVCTMLENRVEKELSTIR